MSSTRTSRLAGPRRSRTDEVQLRVKQLIIERGLKGGDTMPTEFELAQQLGVGRNAVREAFKALQAIGIVEVRHGYGTYVSPLNLTGLTDGLVFHHRRADHHRSGGMTDLIDLRATIEESYVVRLIEECPDADHSAVAALVDVMTMNADDHEAQWETDRQFHQLLYGPLENELLTAMLGAFWDVYHQRNAGLPPVLLAAADHARLHQDILDAVVARDTDRARNAMAAHFAVYHAVRGDLLEQELDAG